MKPQAQSGVVQSVQPSVSNELFQTDGGAELVKGADDQTALLDQDSPIAFPIAGQAGAIPYSGIPAFGTFNTDVALDGGDDLLGPELVTNGAFAADTDWTKDTSWTVAAGVATCSGAQAVAESISQILVLTPATAYRVRFSVMRRVAGGATPVVGVTKGTPRIEVGAYTEVIVAGATDVFEIEGDADFDGDIDNVSVREILG